MLANRELSVSLETNNFHKNMTKRNNNMRKKHFLLIAIIALIDITTLYSQTETKAEGASFVQKLVWLLRNAETNGHYLVELTGNESLPAQSLAFSGKKNITIRLIASGGERTITLSENGSLFYYDRR